MRLRGGLLLVVWAMAVGVGNAQISVAPNTALRAWDYAAVAAAAEGIRKAAEHAHLTAAQRAVASDAAQVAAVADLAALAEAARKYERRLNPSHSSGEPSRQEYEALAAALQTANKHARIVQFGPQVPADLDRIGQIVERLKNLYGPRWHPESLAVAASQLEQAAANVYRLGQEHSDSRDAVSRRAVFLLSRLALSSSHFRQQLDSESDSALTYPDLRVVMDDYARASAALGLAEFGPQVRTELAAAGRALDAARRAYLIPWNFSEAQTLARQSRLAAHSLLAAFGAAAHAGEELKALQDLNLLAAASDRYARALESAPENPGASQPDFLTLLSAYQRAALSFPQLPAGSDAVQAFSSIGQRLQQLHRMYTSQRDLLLAPERISGVPVGRP